MRALQRLGALVLIGALASCATGAPTKKYGWGGQPAAGGGGSGTVTSVSGTPPIAVASGTTTPVISLNAAGVALTKLATQADQTIVGNVSGGTASPIALTATQATALLNVATTSLPGTMSAADKVRANAAQPADGLTWLATAWAFAQTKCATCTKLVFYSVGDRAGAEWDRGTITGSANWALTQIAGSSQVKLSGYSGVTASSARPIRNRARAVLGTSGVWDDIVPNCRTSKFVVASHFNIDATTATAVLPIEDMTDEATQETMLAVRAADGGGATKFSLKVGSAAAQDTGVLVNGTAVHDAYMTNDGTTTAAYFDGNTSAAASGASSTSANAACHIQLSPQNGATAANAGFSIYYYAVFVE